MDIFICRQQIRNKTVHNIIVELKHPNKTLNESHLSQIKKYLRTILELPQFNAEKYTWDYILAGTKYDKFITDEIKNNKTKGEEGIVHSLDNHNIFIKKWSDILIECNLRHEFLNKKLEMEKDKLTKKPKSPEEAVEKSLKEK